MRGMGVLVDSSASLVVAVALVGLEVGGPVLVAPDDGVVGGDSVGKGVALAVVVDVVAVDVEDAAGGAGALLGNGLEAVGDELTVGGGRGLEVLLELGGAAVQGGVGGGVGLGGAAALTVGNGGLLARGAVAGDGRATSQAGVDGLDGLARTSSIDLQRNLVALEAKAATLDKLGRAKLGEAEVANSVDIVLARGIETVDLSKVDSDLLGLTSSKGSEVLLLEVLGGHAQAYTLELGLGSVPANMELIDGEGVQDGALVHDVVALGAIVGDGGLDSGVVNTGQGDADGGGELLGVDGGGRGQTGEGKSSEGVFHDGQRGSNKEKML